MNEKIPVDVLLVEDNPRDAELTIRVFKKHNLADRLCHVKDGAEALDFLLRRGKPDGLAGDPAPRVVLLDLKLPKVDGLEVLRIMKADERTRTIPVVIVTSSAEDPDIEIAYRLGANSYIIKPVQFEAFMEAMHRLGIYWLTANRPLR